MFGSNHSGANAYGRVDEETGVAMASPHKLIVMLFDGALIAVSSALQHMKSGNISAKGQAISKAISIIDSGLRASLNKDVGGEIAINLNALYGYMSDQLLIANLKNQPETLVMVHGLLKELKEAWEAIGSNNAPQAVLPIPKMPEYDALTPRTTRLVKA